MPKPTKQYDFATTGSYYGVLTAVEDLTREFDDEKNPGQKRYSPGAKWVLTAYHQRDGDKATGEMRPIAPVVHWEKTGLNYGEDTRTGKPTQVKFILDNFFNDAAKANLFVEAGHDFAVLAGIPCWFDLEPNARNNAYVNLASITADPAALAQLEATNYGMSRYAANAVLNQPNPAQPMRTPPPARSEASQNAPAAVRTGMGNNNDDIADPFAE